MEEDIRVETEEVVKFYVINSTGYGYMCGYDINISMFS